MRNLNVWAWLKGSKPTFWGRLYRSGVLLTGLVSFSVAWIMSTYGAGFLGFLLGWVPSIIVGVLIGFAWPLLMFAGAIAGGVAAYPLLAGRPWWETNQAISASELKATQDLAVLADLCKDLPSGFRRYTEAIDPSAPVPTTVEDQAKLELAKRARLQELELLRFSALARAKCRRVGLVR